LQLCLRQNIIESKYGEKVEKAKAKGTLGLWILSRK
jgi:hypothetical protein